MMNGIPKIADLGISKIMKTGGLTTKNCTPFYASSEFLTEESYQFPADIWSLGIIFLEMLLGKRITDFVKGFLPPSVREDFPSEILFNQIIEEDLREMVRKMLLKQPTYRLNAKEVLGILNGNKVEDSYKNEKKIEVL
jgi:serine/threonine protein kinase